jgi:hypothetical protein
MVGAFGLRAGVLVLAGGCGGKSALDAVDSGAIGGDATQAIDERASDGPEAGVVDATTAADAANDATGDVLDAMEGDATDGDSAVVLGPKCAPIPTQLAPGRLQLVDSGALATADSADLAIDDSDLFYMIDASPIHLNKVPLRGGAPSTLATLDGFEVFMLVTPRGVVLALTDSSETTGTIVRVPLDGGSPLTLATTSGAPLATLAADGTNVYFADNAGTKSVPLGGGAVQTLTAQSGWLALVAFGLIVTSDNVYRIATNGGPLVTLATGQSSPSVPTACGADLCWVDMLGRLPPALPDSPELTNLMRLTDSGIPSTLVGSWYLCDPGRMIFDGSAFYLVCRDPAAAIWGGSGWIARVPAAGGFPVFPVFTGGTGPGSGQAFPSSRAMAVDDECLYWGNVNYGIFSVAKGGEPGWREPDGGGTCVAVGAPVLCDYATTCVGTEGGSPTCAVETDAAPCGPCMNDDASGAPCNAFSCGEGCTCADAQASVCACGGPGED